MDGDGEIGVTARIEGLLSGEQYFVQRRIFDLKGITLGPDRLIGLVDDRVEQVAIGGSSALFARQSKVEPDPNPRLSWFEERRVAEDTTCDDLKAMMDAEAIGFSRPF